MKKQDGRPCNSTKCRVLLVAANMKQIIGGVVKIITLRKNKVLSRGQNIDTNPKQRLDDLDDIESYISITGVITFTARHNQP